MPTPCGVPLWSRSPCPKLHATHVRAGAREPGSGAGSGSEHTSCARRRRSQPARCRCVAVRTYTPRVTIAHFTLRLVSRRMLAPTVAHLAFARDDGLPLDFIPGQFIQVHFEYADGSPARRSYSLATIRAPGDAPDGT